MAAESLELYRIARELNRAVFARWRDAGFGVNYWIIGRLTGKGAASVWAVTPLGPVTS
jgi:hypothetical protein